MKRVLFLLAFLSLGMSAQSVDCQLVPATSPCDGDQYCVTIQIRSEDGADYIGNSTILLNYNSDVVLFNGSSVTGISNGSYTAIAFDGDQASIADDCEVSNGGFGLTPYSQQGFDGLVPGNLLITTVLLNQTIGTLIFACPSIDGDWEDVSTVCFEILDPSGDPEIAFVGTENGTVVDDSATNFNPDSNDPAEKYDNGSFTGINLSFDELCGIVPPACEAFAGNTIITVDCDTGLVGSAESEGAVVPDDFILAYLLVDEFGIFTTATSAPFTTFGDMTIHSVVVLEDSGLNMSGSITDFAANFEENGGTTCGSVDIVGVGTFCDSTECLADAGILDPLPESIYQNLDFTVSSTGLELNGPDAEYLNAFLLVQQLPASIIIDVSYTGIFNIDTSGDFHIMAVSMLAEELSVPLEDAIGIDAGLIGTVIDCFEFELSPLFAILPFESYDYDLGVSAAAFFDENENGLFDANDSPLLNQTFTLTPTNEIAFTNAEGSTTFIIEENSNYNLEWQPDPLWNLTGSNNYNFSTGVEEYDTTFYFPMNPNNSFVLQELDLSSSITRCNWEVNYWLTYSNTGTTSNSGYVYLVPDEITDYISAYPAPDSTAGDTLYWFYENLPPSYSKLVVIQFEMPSVDFIGESIDFSAEMETWEGTGNRKTEIASELVCAYDPNDKLVSPELYGGDDKNYTLFNDSLEYTIRFQNTGNDTAFTVQVLDELDVNLDLTTFRVIASSHELSTSIDVNSRIATFLFEDIYLPDSFVNEPGSHGFVKYRIQANDGLAESTIVDNTAGIYFDLNDPIITNTVANTMVSSLPTLPVISASPNDLDFGYVALGETGKQTLTIINPGDLTLEITEIISESAEFTVLNNPYTIVGGGEISIEVGFTPTQEIPYLGNLILKSNVGNLPITLKGNGGIDTGIDNLDWRLSVSPNPSNGLFEINWLDENALQNTTLQVYDVSGKIVLVQEMNGNNSRLNLSGQAKGVYYLHLQNDQNSIVKKLLIQ